MVCSFAKRHTANTMRIRLRPVAVWAVVEWPDRTYRTVEAVVGASDGQTNLQRLALVIENALTAVVPPGYTAGWWDEGVLLTPPKEDEPSQIFDCDSPAPSSEERARSEEW